MSFLIDFVSLLFWLLNMAIFVRVLLSWFSVNPYSPAVVLLYQITDPILEPLRRVIPPVGPLDITPIVAMILLDVVRRLILSSLVALAF